MTAWLCSFVVLFPFAAHFCTAYRNTRVNVIVGESGLSTKSQDIVNDRVRTNRGLERFTEEELRVATGFLAGSDLAHFSRSRVAKAEKGNSTEAEITFAPPKIPRLWRKYVDYFKVKPLGKGSFGTVYKMQVMCSKKGEAHHVAMKIQDYSTAKAKKLIDAETKLMRTVGLSSPYVISVLGAVNGAKAYYGKMFYLMELMNQGEFLDVFKKGFKTNYQNYGGRGAVYAMLIHILKGLKVIHNAGMVHGDMKLENAMVNCRERSLGPGRTDTRCFAQVIDLGLSQKISNRGVFFWHAYILRARIRKWVPHSRGKSSCKTCN